jgi:hypothetical protein
MSYTVTLNVECTQRQNAAVEAHLASVFNDIGRHISKVSVKAEYEDAESRLQQPSDEQPVGEKSKGKKGKRKGKVS